MDEPQRSDCGKTARQTPHGRPCSVASSTLTLSWSKLVMCGDGMLTVLPRLLGHHRTGVHWQWVLLEACGPQS